MQTGGSISSLSSATEHRVDGGERVKVEEGLEMEEEMKVVEVMEMRGKRRCRRTHGPSCILAHLPYLRYSPYLLPVHTCPFLGCPHMPHV